MYNVVRFDNIQLNILNELLKAKQSISVAGARFTDCKLFQSLCKKARQNVQVQLIILDDEINNHCGIDYSELESAGGKVLKVGKEKELFIHNNLWVIDKQIVITCSRNRANVNEQNQECISIIDNPELAEICTEAFYLLQKPYRDYSPDTLAVELFPALIIYFDNDIAAMYLEIKALELQITGLNDEKNEIEKLLFTFNNRYNMELGELTLEILLKKMEKLKEEAQNDKSKEKEAEDAESEYKGYNQSYSESKKERIYELTEELIKELKNKFRKASKLCHPDKVSESQKEEAEAIFMNLKNAYDRNDLDAVSQILSVLETGMFSEYTYDLNEKQKLVVIVNQLRNKRNNLEKEIVKIKKSYTYQIVINISVWDDYFAEKKARLKEELERL